MPRFQDRPDNGRLVVHDPNAAGRSEVYFEPSQNALDSVGHLSASPVKILEIDRRRNTLWIFPIDTLPRPGGSFMEPKYDQIRSFEVPLDEAPNPEDLDEYAVEDLLDELPRGLTKDFQFGLGLPVPYRQIFSTIEKLTQCTHVEFSRSRATGVDGGTFVLSLIDFEDLRLEFDRIVGRGNGAVRRVKAATAHNVFARVLGLPEQSPSRGTHPFSKVMTDAAAGRLNDEEREELIGAAVAASRALAETRPRAITQLRTDLDLITLDTLIEGFEANLTKHRPESFWQKFFVENPFALHLAFGFPVLRVQGQASVGGRTFAGAGDKLADFLVKNPMTNNVGVIEIKRPDSPLLRATPYRDGVYGPHRELSGAITQTLDQKYQLEKSLISLKDASDVTDLESYAITCCLVAGMTPEGKAQSKSLELIRHNSKHVSVITYDELLRKLVQLRDFLRSGDSDRD